MRKNLRKIRKSKGYSQEALSVEANVSITNIYNIENYKKKTVILTFSMAVFYNIIS